MSKQKGLTLQQYIECYNIKKQLKQRSKQKERQKSQQKLSAQQKSSTQLTLQVADCSINQSTQNLRQSLNQSIYDKVDSRAKNLNKQLQEKIKEIKIECRGFIENDKDFSMFVVMMDQLMDRFRFEVMRIHRQNMVLFKVSENQQNLLNQRDEISRSILQKSFKEQYDESKIEYEQNKKYDFRESRSKNKINQNRENHHIGGNKDHQKRKQHSKQRQTQIQKKEVVKLTSLKSLPLTSTGSILPGILLAADKQEQQKMIKDINSMNESGKIRMNTQTVDKSYPYHNISFGTGFYNHDLQKHKPQQHSNKKSTVISINTIDRNYKPANIPKSPSRKYDTDNKFNKLTSSSASKTPKSKLKSKTKLQKGSQYQTLRQSQYLINLPNKSQQKKLLRTTSKSKQKTKKSSTNK